MTRVACTNDAVCPLAPRAVGHRKDCPVKVVVQTRRVENLPLDEVFAAGIRSMGQQVKVTNLNTGVESEATIVHSDFRAVKDVLDQHEKQAVKLEPLGVEYWDAFERGEPGARDQIPPPTTYMPPEPAPARPWWKFWGRRG